MPYKKDSQNKILSKISVAARTALKSPRNVEFARHFGAGPSIRSRVRLALAAAFLVAAPTLFVGVLRTENVAEKAVLLTEYEDYTKELLNTLVTLKDLHITIWAYVAQPEYENASAVVSSSRKVKRKIENLIINKPKNFDVGSEAYLKTISSRLHKLIKRAIANEDSLAKARLIIFSLNRELEFVNTRVKAASQMKRQEALGALSTVGRDQLILFLALAFVFPIFLGLIPSWLVYPLNRLRQVAQKIELTQLRDMAIGGHDEVALLARSLKSYLLKKENLDQKKSSKIFEMRNILRTVINGVNEPVLVIDELLMVNYTNEAASKLSGLKTHQIEGKEISECFYSPILKKAAAKAFSGDVSKDPLPISIEVADGRTFDMSVKIGVVRNRDGEVSRAVVVLYLA